MRAPQLGYAIFISAISLVGACRGNANPPAGTTREPHEAIATTGAIEQDSSKAQATADRNVAVAGSAIGDGWITTKIHARFAEDDAVKGRRIDVDTSDGVVVLKGSVGSKLEYERAEELARSTDGVKRVVNRLTVD
jgi:osmotically-inducible protein OsmY